jgi:Guanylate kinase
LQNLNGVEDLKSLQELIVSHNELTSLHPLTSHPCLIFLDVQSNLIHDMKNLDDLSTIPTLTNLLIGDNPIVTESTDIWEYKNSFPLHSNAIFKPSFRLYVLYKVPRLTILDKLATEIEEKVAAMNMYNPDDFVSQSIQHVNIIKILANNPAMVNLKELVKKKKLTPVVICGATGVEKRLLITKLVEEFPQIYESISHTTKTKEDEEDGANYHFVTQAETNRLNTECNFVEIMNILGNQYGISKSAIDKIISRDKVCVIDVEYEVSLCLPRELCR